MHVSDRKIKVAHIITRLIVGGAQENTIYTVLGLSRMPEYDVTLYTGPQAGAEGSLMDGEWKKEVPCVVLNNMRRNLTWRDAIMYRQLVKLFRCEKYDIVHTHSSKAGILGRLAARKAGVPVIIHTIHGLPFHEYQNVLARKFYIFSERKAARACDKIISVANIMTQKALAAGVGSPELFTTIYSGMELDLFLNSAQFRNPIRKQLGIADDEIVIGKIARLFYLKGHEYLFTAASEILKRFPKTRFLLLHDGILRKQFERQLEQMGIRDKFIFAGLVPPTDIPKYISAMDILVHTSLREGLARTLPQALACSKPVVSFDIDGAPEVVKNGETGFLVKPMDSQGLADALIRLMQNEPLRCKMGENGRKLVDPIFRSEYMVKKIHNFYQELLRQK
jgi:glycosyltransferase involved in cell wall biosynthesis